MQYNSQVYSYQRVNKENNGYERNKFILDIFDMKFILYFICAFLISRVLMINSAAPFGIAFAISILMHSNVKEKIIGSAGAVLGYITLYNNLQSFYIYVIAIMTITFFSFIIDKLSCNKKILIYSMIILCEFMFFNFILNKMNGTITFFTSILELLYIIPIYYIINYSMICFKNIKTKHLFSGEEVVSMALIVSLAIAGTWGVSFYNINLRNVVALISILIITYVNGMTVGAASGIAIGAVIGMSSNMMPIYISVFAICGLISGIFKNTNKWIMGISYTITFLIIILYEKVIPSFNIIDGMISCGIFFAIPNKILQRIETEINFEKKQESISQGYIDKIKNIFIKRLDSFSDVLFTMSNILNNLVDNDKLALKTKSSALVENLADRVCNTCNMKNICWKRELYYTYAAFEELISNFQDNRVIVPNEIDRKCIHRNALIKNTEEIVNNYIINEMWRIRLSQGREILANQINNMAGTIKEIQKEFNDSLNFNGIIEKKVIEVLNRNDIKFKDIMCINDDNDRLLIKLSMEACGGRQICVKEILPLVNEVSERCMCVCDDGCKINPDTNLCMVEFQETPKYHVASHVSRRSKHGETENGDSYSFGKLSDGSYMIIISDGMGSGAKAGHESKAAIDLIEKFTMSGLSKITAINSVNSIMTLKFSEDEKFSTIDLCSIDLYSGNVEFMKVGAVTSFIKRKDRVEIINSKTLPIGVLDKVDIDTKDKKVQNGDIIVMISDGITDYDNENAGKINWIVEYLENCGSNNPKDIAEEIVKRSVKMGGGKAKDDMTVIVSKIYSLY
ncbi:stage II sporulation protein E [Clostridium pasteurianum]|uniref:Stage II sporulation protein E n=1 Tax=Clostridium pasteurianum BC1 TaxID=86416 RepID=R4K7V3_CLOPA|nr:stage II sporulation protein E [Clostridium pasteurianum]AGK99267.1 stage II sporulation protein E [Clostridium pasteurianum BC1]